MRRLVFTSVAAVLVALPATLSGAAPIRSYAVGNFLLELDGKSGGYLESVEGGSIHADVIREPSDGSSLFAKKHIGNPQYEDFTIRSGMPSGDGLAGWMVDFFKTPSQSHDGAIVATTAKLVPVTRHEFRDALLTEIGFPALDGASKDPAFFTLKIAPGSIEVEAADGSVLPPPQEQKQKQWHAANFRFTLGDLPTKRVSKVDSFTVKQSTSPSAPGEEREPQREPTKIEIPNLTLTLSVSDIGPWENWLETFVVGGQNSDADEKSGSIEFLDSTLRTVLGRLDLQHVGIVRLLRLAPSGDPDALGRFQVELYVEEMRLQLDPK
jgi:hypothetical protein